MTKRSPALLALTAFVLISTACVSWGRKDVKSLTSPLPEGTAVLSVVLTSGQTLEFSKANPGRVRGYTVVGTGKDAAARRVEIMGPFSSMTKRADGTITEVVDRNGRTYAVREVLSKGEDRMTIVASASNRVSIPLTEVSVIQVRKSNALPITAITLGVLVVGPVIGALIF